MEQAAADDQPLGRRLDVQDAAAGRHPLRVAIGDDAAATIRVAVLEGAVDDVRHGLEATVRVPGGALGLTRRVVDLAHLIQMNEGVEVGGRNAGEGATNGEALAFEAARGGRDGAHGAQARVLLIELVTFGRARMLSTVTAGMVGAGASWKN